VRPIAAIAPARPIVRPVVFALLAAAAALVAQGIYALRSRGPALGPPGMVLIPGGEFGMGTDDPRSMANERPSHRVRVESFWMDEHDVTNAEFRRFVQATGYVTTAERKPDWEELMKQLPQGTARPDEKLLVPGSLVFTPAAREVPLDDLSAWWRWVPGASWQKPSGPESNIDDLDDHPVVQVSWDDAVAYATWAKKRLPTEAEWEYAARGGLAGKRYPWGDDPRPGGRHLANTWQGTFPVHDDGEDGFRGTSPVKAFPPNGYGLYDMAGNVWQWCSDWYRADVHQQAALRGHCDPGGPAASDSSGPRRVIKGGSFLCNPSYCESYRPSARRGTPPDTGSSHVGFRTALSVDAWESQRGAR
jgi:formylglycine-generating enzyme required for sulfatase activity